MKGGRVEEGHDPDVEVEEHEEGEELGCLVVRWGEHAKGEARERARNDGKGEEERDRVVSRHGEDLPERAHDDSEEPQGVHRGAGHGCELECCLWSHCGCVPCDDRAQALQGGACGRRGDSRGLVGGLPGSPGVGTRRGEPEDAHEERLGYVEAHAADACGRSTHRAERDQPEEEQGGEEGGLEEGGEELGAHTCREELQRVGHVIECGRGAQQPEDPALLQHPLRRGYGEVALAIECEGDEAAEEEDVLVAPLVPGEGV
mmetsp:Transcript_17064/g.46117  ORF Transcript_17064/g.46117 Transcript_17064/m.46117 type:complete len:260 (+) Transcript_17064:678-1457(+)